MSASESPAELLERLARERALEADRRPAGLAIAVTGGRDYQPSRDDLSTFWAIFDRERGTILHHGDAPGVDRAVAASARNRPTLQIVAHPADWRGLGRAAGPIRNREMLMACAALIAFPGGRGTESCVAEARRQGKPVYFVKPPQVATPPTTSDPLRTQPWRSVPEPEEPDGCQHVWNWTFWPSQAAWRGRCFLCSRSRWASEKEAAALERLVDEHCRKVAPRNS